MTSDDTSRDDLDRVQLKAALLRLDEANSRIAQLEQEVRQARHDTDGSDRKLAELLRHLADANDGHSMFPAYTMSRIWQQANIVERQQVWLRSCDALGIAGALRHLVPHDDDTDPITIMVRGSGGYGDMLYLSAVVRGLYHHFGSARILVMHEHPGVRSILADNPYVVEASHLAGEQGHRFLQLAAAMDVFDLIADVRYAVTYATPPRSRVDGDFLAEANSRSWNWQRYVRRDWPYLNNIFAREVVAKGFSKYSFSLHTANIAPQLGNFGDFFHARMPDDTVTALLGGPYVTVHHGADRNMAGVDGLQTKNLPLAKWLDIVAQVKAAGLRTVQLGEAHEHLIAGVDGDLRGLCSMAQSAMVLRHAQVHIDTEGGLVHLARAVGTPSVVAFGPTSLPFFGYPENTNIAAETCGDCWWTSRDWSQRCPRALPTVACMESHSADRLADAAIALSQTTHRLSFAVRRDAGGNGIVANLGRLIPPEGKGAIVGSNGGVVAQLSQQGLIREDIVLFALDGGFHQTPANAGLYPATCARVPLDSNTMDWALCCVSDRAGPVDAMDLASLLFEGARIVGTGRLILMLDLMDDAVDLSRLDAALHALPGARLLIDLGGAPETWGSGVYEMAVEPCRLATDSRPFRNAVRKGLRKFEALASDVIGRLGETASGGHHA